MKFELFNAEANKIWKNATGVATPDQLRFELNVYKKLLAFFQVGDYYYLVFNLTMGGLELVSKEIESVLGYGPIVFLMQVLLDNTHPDDRPYFLNFAHKAGEFFKNLPVEKLMKYKIRYDYRIKKKNGGYTRILHQSTVIGHDEQGGIIRTLSVHTDISHLKQTGNPILSIIGLDGGPSYINIDVEKVFTATSEFLSKREKQVLLLLIEVKASREIAEVVHITKQTVDNNRKNMLRGNNLNNTIEMAMKAVCGGWI